MAERVESEYQCMRGKALSYIDMISVDNSAKAIVYAILALAEAVRESGIAVPYPNKTLHKDEF